MWKEIANNIGKYISGSHGLLGRFQGAGVALALGLGCVRVVSTVFAIDLFIWRQFLRPAKKLKKYGTWAAVTGATDGIGRAYCDVLAKQGLNVLLISRTESKLKQAAEEISAMHGVETKVLAMDLAAAGNLPCEAPAWTTFKATIDSLDIGVFINNAGQAHVPALTHNLTDAEVNNVVAINCAAVVKATHAVLPSMLRRGKGAIVNISSAAGTPEATPYMAVYGATKSFVQHFSLSLAAEYHGKGIDVQTQAPAYVSTNMSGKPATLSAPSASTYAGAAVRHVGYEGLAVPYWKHALDRPPLHLPRQLIAPLIMRQMKKEQEQKAAKMAADAKRAE